MSRRYLMLFVLLLTSFAYSSIASAAQRTGVKEFSSPSINGFSMMLAESESDGAKFEPVDPSRPVCEWHPVQVLKPSQQCGFNDIGVPNPGLYECGLKPKKDWSGCEEFCRFIECREP